MTNVPSRGDPRSPAKGESRSITRRGARECARDGTRDPGRLSSAPTEVVREPAPQPAAAIRQTHPRANTLAEAVMKSPEPVQPTVTLVALAMAATLWGGCANPAGTAPLDPSSVALIERLERAPIPR